MHKLNIEFLINTPIDEILDKLDNIFEILLQKIKLYNNLEVLFNQVRFEVIEASEQFEFDIIDFGVKKNFKDGSLFIFIFKNYSEFIRIILLRESYKCFIPLELHENETINIFINQKVENDLQNSEFIEEWKEKLVNSVVNYDFMQKEFDRLERFLKQESTETAISPFQFFFSYIRRNVDLIRDVKEEFYSNKNFYDKIFEEYTQKYTSYTDETLETIRVISEIFYRVNSYRSLLDYQHLFKEFKESGIIKTTLSIRRFTDCMKWIKNFSNIAPTYQVNWSLLDIKVFLCFLKFHPLINIIDIYKIINRLPFFLWPNYSRASLEVDVWGYFLIPEIYLNDLTSILAKLESEGYLTKKNLYNITEINYSINLNYFRNLKKKHTIINPNKRDYFKEYEINFRFNYGRGKFDSKITLFDWFLIDRIQYFSIVGLGFERKNETIKTFKSDLLNEVLSQQKMVSEIETNLNKIQNSNDLKENFLDIIENNKSYGFFYIEQMINDYITILNLISDVLSKNPSINNLSKFQSFIKNQGISRIIEDNLLLNIFRTNTLNEFISLYLKNKNAFKSKVEEYYQYSNLLKSFNDLKLFSLDSIISIILDKLLIKKICQSKETKLKSSYENFNAYKITSYAIEERIDALLNNKPPVIKPLLINTIVPLPSNYFPTLILKRTTATLESIDEIKSVFPWTITIEMEDYYTHEKFINFQIDLPNLKLKEKQILYSIIWNLFRNDIIFANSYLRGVFVEAYSRKDFFDLEHENFFYTKDLFIEFYKYIQHTISIDVNPIEEQRNPLKGDQWAKQKFVSHLIDIVESRTSRENIDFNFAYLKNLIDYHLNLKSFLSNLKEFKLSKNQFFFKNYISSIKLLPSFQSFGLGQYHLYFHPIDLEEIDFKHLLHNSFQKIKYSARIDNSNSFLIKFIWPYRNPNISLINWLTKSKKAIREYCLFFIKKVFQIFHFSYNLSLREWDLDPNRFKIYFQNVLFNPEYKLVTPELKEYNMGELNISNYFTPESPEFKALCKIYSWKSIDIKSYLGTRNYTIIKHITEMLDKNLIYPIISVKNLDLIEKVYIILPDVKKEYNEKILNIFSFFNIGYIYEIEGEYYIQGLSQATKFENGLMIRLYLPDCQLDKFEKLFDLLFDYLEIKHYLILNDLVDGKNFLKSIYGSLDFLKSYNPLKNLIWNNKDKIWINNKLFDGNFGKIYYNL